MNKLHLTALIGVALLTGWLMATGWQSFIASAFESSGATVVTTRIDALPIERLGITLLTGLAVLVALSISRIAQRITGRCIWPVWGLFLLLLIGENLGIGLRLITIATITLPAAVDAAGGSTPVIDLAAANLIAWTVAGLLSAAAISLGLVLAMGQLEK